MKAVDRRASHVQDGRLGLDREPFDYGGNRIAGFSCPLPRTITWRTGPS